MMNWLLLISFSLFGLCTVTAVELDYLRTNYSETVENAQLCQRLIAELEKKDAEPIYMGYLGALQAIWAGHAKGPIAKLRSFNTGKSNLEKAVAADPDNVELRFLRFSIQQNCPRFLGYRDNMKEDRKFIQDNIHHVKSAQLRSMYLAIL